MNTLLKAPPNDVGGEEKDFVQNQCATERRICREFSCGIRLVSVGCTPHFFLRPFSGAPMISFVTKRRHCARGVWNVWRDKKCCLCLILEVRFRCKLAIHLSLGRTRKGPGITQLKKRVFLADSRRINPLRQTFRKQIAPERSEEGDLSVRYMSHIKLDFFSLDEEKFHL